MTHEDWLGLALWVTLFYPVWSPRCRRIRKDKKREGATRSTSKDRQVGPAWEQDAPYPECFEEDDLDV